MLGCVYLTVCLPNSFLLSIKLRFSIKWNIIYVILHSLEEIFTPKEWGLSQVSAMLFTQDISYDWIGCNRKKKLQSLKSQFQITDSHNPSADTRDLIKFQISKNIKNIVLHWILYTCSKFMCWILIPHVMYFSVFSIFCLG